MSTGIRILLKPVMWFLVCNEVRIGFSEFSFQLAENFQKCSSLVLVVFFQIR